MNAKIVVKEMGKRLKVDAPYWTPLAVPMAAVFFVMGVTIRHQLFTNPDTSVHGKGYIGKAGKYEHWFSKVKNDNNENPNDFKLFPKLKIN